MSGTITSAANGTNVPEDDGFQPGKPFVLVINGGTTIDAVLQKLNLATDTWADVNDVDNYQEITGAWEHTITCGTNEKFRIAVTTATGTWGWYVAPLNT